MSFITIIIASAGMSLGLVGPEGSQHKGMDADKTTEHVHQDGDSAKQCAACAAKADGTKCATCAAHAIDQDTPLPKIDSALYGNAAWPEYNKGEGLYSKDLQGQTLPVALGNETWISKEAKLDGKVLVLDFWATWCGPCRAAMPKLNKLQEDNKDNLAVVAIAGQSEKEDTVRSFLAEHKESTNNLFDAKQSVFRPFESQGIPLVVVISTDGVIRWIGNPHDPKFQAAVDQVLKVDPLINAKG